jgi:hypothetical protein
VKPHVKVLLVYEGTDVQARDRLHEVARPPLITTRTEVGADDEGPSAPRVRDGLDRPGATATEETTKSPAHLGETRICAIQAQGRPMRCEPSGRGVGTST